MSALTYKGDGELQSFIVVSVCSAKNGTPVKEEEKERCDASPVVLSVETKGTSWFLFLAILFPR